MNDSTVAKKIKHEDDRTAKYGKLATLFIYPVNETYKEKIRDVQDCLLRVSPDAAKALQPFTDFTCHTSIMEIQELFLRSFDLQAITTLDIGFVLFGEDYKRGKLLVHLNEEHKLAGNDCENELSDHLPNLLRLLPKMKDKIMQEEIATLLLIPAVEKMIGEFSIDKMEKKDVVYKKHQKVLLDYSQNYRAIFQYCLQAVYHVLLTDFGDAWEKQKKETQSFTDPNIPGTSPADEKPIKDFSQNIETEMLTEK